MFPRYRCFIEDGYRAASERLLEGKMFVTIRRYSPKNGAINKASMELLRRQIHDEFLPIVQQIPGFRGYYVVNLDNRELMTLSLFETVEGSAESTRCAAEYTLRNPLVYELGRPEVTEGEVLTSVESMSPQGQGEDAAATALALWYEESRGMLLATSEQ
jgi:hypothetical protein